MSVDVVNELVIDRPIADVVAFAGDPSNAPTWYDNIQSVEWITEPPVRLGARMAFVAHFLGRRLAYTYEVTELSDRRMVMRTAEGPFPMETIYEWEPVDAGRTRMSLRNRGEPAGFSALVAPLMARAMKRATRKDLEKLKAILEGMRQS